MECLDENKNLASDYHNAFLKLLELKRQWLNKEIEYPLSNDEDIDEMILEMNERISALMKLGYKCIECKRTKCDDRVDIDVVNKLWGSIKRRLSK